MLAICVWKWPTSLNSALSRLMRASWHRAIQTAPPRSKSSDNPTAYPTQSATLYRRAPLRDLCTGLLVRGKQFLEEHFHELVEVIRPMLPHVPVFGGPKRIGVCPRLQPGAGLLICLRILQTPLDRVRSDNALPQPLACAS